MGIGNYWDLWATRMEIHATEILKFSARLHEAGHLDASVYLEEIRQRLVLMEELRKEMEGIIKSQGGVDDDGT